MEHELDSQVVLKSQHLGGKAEAGQKDSSEHVTLVYGAQEISELTWKGRSWPLST